MVIAKCRFREKKSLWACVFRGKLSLWSTNAGAARRERERGEERSAAEFRQWLRLPILLWLARATAEQAANEWVSVCVWERERVREFFFKAKEKGLNVNHSIQNRIMSSELLLHSECLINKNAPSSRHCLHTLTNTVTHTHTSANGNHLPCHLLDP